MTVQRLRDPYAIGVPGAAGAYLQTPLVGSTYNFISTGQIGTTAGYQYRVHQFTAGLSGSLQFSGAGFIDILLIAAGGAGGFAYYGSSGTERSLMSGGGGAGGLVLIYQFEVDIYTQYAYSIPNFAISENSGANATFGPFTAYGGGRGGQYANQGVAISGGSGAGGTYHQAAGSSSGGAGFLSQGKNGGTGASPTGGGGGGFSTVGFNGGTAGTNSAGIGGSGISINFDGTLRAFCAGGGAGSAWSVSGASGGLVDGVVTGGSGTTSNSPGGTAFNGTVATAPGCGGGGSGTSANVGYGQLPGNSSGGILFIRYVI